MSKRPRHIDGYCGFTLVELLVVLALVGISVAAVVPRFRGTLSAWQVKQSARNVQASLQLAGQWARVRQEAVVFALNERKRSFVVRPQRDPSGTNDSVLVERQSMGQGVQIVRTQGLREVGQEKILTFGPDGTSQDAVMVLSNSEVRSARTMWQIALGRDGTVQCQETLANE